MSQNWDERWQQKRGEVIPEADSWLVRQKQFLTGGNVLDLACGRGRNSFFLADLGYEVLAVDSSPTALELLLSTASDKKLPIKTKRHNLERDLPFLPEQISLILCFYFLHRPLFPEIKERISPGGLFIGRSFCYPKPNSEESEIIYQPGELAELFRDWEILSYEEGVEVAKRGGTLAGIVARKPVNRV